MDMYNINPTMLNRFEVRYSTLLLYVSGSPWIRFSASSRVIGGSILSVGITVSSLYSDYSTLLPLYTLFLAFLNDD